MAEKKYEDYVQECAATRRDLDTILHPTYGELKKAFELVFGEHGFGKGDFKRLADMVYYQGGYPSENSPPKEVALADDVARVLHLENILDRDTFKEYLKERGIEVKLTTVVERDGTWSLESDKEDDLKNYLAGAGIQGSPPRMYHEFLNTLVDRALEMQKEICQTADTIKVDAAAEVETKFKIKKGSFIKAVNLAAVKLRKGEGKMAEKLDEYLEKLENQEEAVEPLRTDRSKE